MLDKFKFPNGGFEVEVCRKQDIIDSIDDPTVDKDILFAIITQCEADANDFLNEGRWTGIPYLGNMRVPKHRQKFCEINGSEIIDAAKETLDERRYSVFKREFNLNLEADVRQERLYRYMTSCYVTKHKRTYNRFLKDIRANNTSNKDAFARFMCYSCIDLSNYIPEE